MHCATKACMYCRYVKVQTQNVIHYLSKNHHHFILMPKNVKVTTQKYIILNYVAVFILAIQYLFQQQNNVF